MGDLDQFARQPHKPPNVNANARPSTLNDALERLPATPERGFRFLTRDREEVYYDYPAFREEAQRHAAFLQGLGLNKGDRIALIIPEPRDFVLSFVGASLAGLVPVPMSPQASFKSAGSYLDIVTHIVKTAEAPVALCMQSNFEPLAPLPERLPGVRLYPIDTLFEGTAPVLNAPLVKSDDLCFLQFTSGSTSKPKGVMVTHQNLVTNAHAFMGPAGIDLRAEDRGVSWLPLFHDMGLIGFALGSIICDMPTTFIPTETFARSPRLWLEKISELRASVTCAPNFAYQLLTKRIRERDLETLDLSTLRIAGCGAEPIRAKTLLAFADKLAPCGFKSSAFMPTYGMAEATLAITFHQLGEEIKIDRVDPEAMKTGQAKAATEGSTNELEIVSCGPPFPELEVCILDEQGKPRSEREVGEISIRGPSVTAGYYKNQEATDEAYKDGWLHTGDLGYLAEGNLYICGRIKDMIIIRGANHYPQDIEWSVTDLEGVRRDNVVAFSVLQDGIEELIIAAEAHSGDAAILRETIPAKVNEEFGLSTAHVAVVPMGTLPKTSSGKTQRRKTKLLYETGELPEHPL